MEVVYLHSLRQDVRQCSLWWSLGRSYQGCGRQDMTKGVRTMSCGPPRSVSGGEVTLRRVPQELPPQ